MVRDNPDQVSWTRPPKPSRDVDRNGTSRLATFARSVETLVSARRRESARPGPLGRGEQLEQAAIEVPRQVQSMQRGRERGAAVRRDRGERPLLGADGDLRAVQQREGGFREVLVAQPDARQSQLQSVRLVESA